MGFGFLGHGYVEVSVSTTKFGLLAGRLKLLQTVLADGLQHAEARLAVRTFRLRKEALGGQRGYAVQDVEPEGSVRVADGLSGLQRAAAEDGQPAEQHLLVRLQEIVAPGDGVPERLLTSGKVTSAA